MKYWLFERFEVSIPDEAVSNCSHPGSCDEDVEFWSEHIERPKECNQAALRDELREYGCWDDEELGNDADNWQRIVWITAGNIQEDERSTV